MICSPFERWQLGEHVTAYDATHNRVKQTEVKAGATTTTIYVDDLAAGFSAEKISTSATAYKWNDYIVMPSGIAYDGKASGIRIGMHTTTVAGTSTATANKYFILDHLGSTAVVAKDDGTVDAADRQAYDPWGKRRYANGNDDTAGVLRSQTNRGFTSHEHIDDVGLINMNARIYDPQLGRFMSADPVTATPYDAQSLNRYTYVDNRPLSLTDPTGLCTADGQASFQCGNAGAKAKEDNGNRNGASTADNISASAKSVLSYIANSVLGSVRDALVGVDRATNKKVSLGEVPAVVAAILAITPIPAARGAGVVEKAASEVVAKIEGKVAAKAGIYEFTAATGKTYVGQSGNIEARIAQHLESGKLMKEDLSSLRTTEVTGGKIAREIAEQLRINELGGVKNLENARNPIGPAREYLLPVNP